MDQNKTNALLGVALGGWLGAIAMCAHAIAPDRFLWGVRPNEWSALATIAFLMGIGWQVQADRLVRWSGLAGLLCASGAWAVLIILQSRAAVAVCLVGLVILLVQSANRRAFLAGLLICLVCGLGIAGGLSERLASLGGALAGARTDVGIDDRLALWHGALAMVGNAPWTGFGSESFTYVYIGWFQLLDRHVPYWHALNDALSLWTNYGVLAVISYLMVFLFVLLGGLRAASDVRRSSLVLWPVGLVILGCGCFTHLLQPNTMGLLFLGVGLLAAGYLAWNLSDRWRCMRWSVGSSLALTALLLLAAWVVRGDYPYRLTTEEGAVVSEPLTPSGLALGSGTENATGSNLTEIAIFGSPGDSSTSLAQLVSRRLAQEGIRSIIVDPAGAAYLQRHPRAFTIALIFPGAPRPDVAAMLTPGRFARAILCNTPQDGDPLRRMLAFPDVLLLDPRDRTQTASPPARHVTVLPMHGEYPWPRTIATWWPHASAWLSRPHEVHP